MRACFYFSFLWHKLSALRSMQLHKWSERSTEYPMVLVLTYCKIALITLRLVLWQSIAIHIAKKRQKTTIFSLQCISEKIDKPTLAVGTAFFGHTSSANHEIVVVPQELFFNCVAHVFIIVGLKSICNL